MMIGPSFASCATAPGAASAQIQTSAKRHASRGPASPRWIAAARAFPICLALITGQTTLADETPDDIHS
jgi:hypothetical protein